MSKLLAFIALCLFAGIGFAEDGATLSQIEAKHGPLHYTRAKSFAVYWDTMYQIEPDGSGVVTFRQLAEIHAYAAFYASLNIDYKELLEYAGDLAEAYAARAASLQAEIQQLRLELAIARGKGGTE